MSDWINVPDDIGNWFGFVYRITDQINCRAYIGRKGFWQQRKYPPLKGMKRARRVRVSSDWKSYYGSNAELSEQVRWHGTQHFTREMISFAESLGQLKMLEAWHIINEGALQSPAYYNERLTLDLRSSHLR